ncbi:hypothetical protein BGZ63DRAFT_386803 [Mariannaea sp. PMI_226]|nr:hypothetical protein BGZ63DRAFT_386803 [Mariannaea sp. PMI_226]
MAERPGIYVHFEFGVSWTPRQPPKSRQITYMSRSMRDRANQFPRQLPAPNTNFLAVSQPQTLPVATQLQYQPQPLYQVQNLHQHATIEHPTYPRDTLVGPPPENASPGQHQINTQIQQQWETLLSRRTSRSQSRSSHERGSSAPPPFNDSPWDANPGPSFTNPIANNLPRDQRRLAPETEKALPATPNQFRLGEDDLPWSAWTFPMGYSEDENDEVAEYRGQSSSRSIEPSHESSHYRDATDRDQGRAIEMQSLAAALVTVDNGFEDQWWYQGPRLVHLNGNVISQASVDQYQRNNQTATAPELPMGSAVAAWAVSPMQPYSHPFECNQGPLDNETPHWESLAVLPRRSSIADVVSPISDLSSPVPSFRGLRRSLTTRSDELHM